MQHLISTISQVILGKEQQVKLAVCCLIANGHLLIEDLPGMGKTTFAQALAKAFGLDYKRVQFTSDLLPSDIVGSSIYRPDQQAFQFIKGPVFTQLLLADEINRSSPRTQSALLEAMEEGQVSVDGERYHLPAPFFVIATQNPSSQFGTYPLPESQLDRFFMRIQLGYPSESAERQLLIGDDGRQRLQQIQSEVSIKQLAQYQQQIKALHCSDNLIDYVQRLIAYTRDSSQLSYGLSPRGAQALILAAKSWAFIAQRDYVQAEDIQAVLAAVVDHRVGYANEKIASISRQMLNDVTVLA